MGWVSLYSVAKAGGGRPALILALAAITVPVALLINRIVPGAYLDEEFHIRQVQHYCRGDFEYWDPKITTFPGLYILSLAYAGALHPVGLLTGLSGSLTDLCQPVVLRSVNVVISLLCTLLFREIVYHLDPEKREFRASAKAFVLSLYPLHWFFNFLYYTEVGSATAVMAMYLASLKHAYWSSALFGAISILFRQTNVVWTMFVLCVGVLDFLQKDLDWKKTSQGQDELLFPQKEPNKAHKAKSEKISIKEDGGIDKSEVENEARRDGMRKRQSVRGVPLSSDGAKSMAMVPNAFGGSFSNKDTVAAVWALIRSAWFRKVEVLWNFGPLLLVILAFIGFVFQNGSIVVGDKSAHKVSPHFAQLLYCGLVCAGFQAAYHCIPENLSDMWGLLKTSSRNMPLVYSIIAFATAFISVHYFSSAHPYLLADNRHYVFYFWKDVLQRHWSMKYLFIPLYLFSWSSILFMLGQTQTVLWVVAFCLAVIGVLVPTPLLEFRYYNVPFYFMFLHGCQKQPHEKYSLALMALQFTAVNAVTVYIYLFWPFGWPSEPGKLQRFLW